MLTCNPDFFLQPVDSHPAGSETECRFLGSSPSVCSPTFGDSNDDEWETGAAVVVM